MNKRIKELAVEARLLTGWPVGEVEYQKFAELIVRECMEVVGDCSVEYATRPQIIEEIKEHFGVEE